MRRIPDHRKLLPVCLIEVGIIKRHGRLEAGERASRPGNVHGGRIHDHDGTGDSSPLQKLSALTGRLVMRAQWSRNGGRSTADIGDDLTAQILSREIVVLR